MPLTTVRGVRSVIRRGQLSIHKNELLGHVVKALARDSHHCFYAMKLSFHTFTS